MTHLHEHSWVDVAADRVRRIVDYEEEWLIQAICQCGAVAVDVRYVPVDYEEWLIQAICQCGAVAVDVRYVPTNVIEY